MTLKISPRSPKSNQLFIVPQENNIEIGQNLLFASRGNVRKPYIGRNLIFQSTSVTLKIRSRSLKSYQLFPPSQQCSYASLVKSIHWFRRKRKETKIRGWRRQRYGIRSKTSFVLGFFFLLIVFLDWNWEQQCQHYIKTIPKVSYRLHI